MKTQIHKKKQEGFSHYSDQNQLKATKQGKYIQK